MRSSVPEKILDWNDADGVLAQLAALHRQCTVLEASRDEVIQQARDHYKASVTPIEDQIERLEAELHRFTLTHQEELDGRSKKLEHGRLGFRLVKKLIVRKIETAVNWLLETKRMKYLRVDYELNKEALAEAPDDVLRACGARVKPRDQFFYEIDGEHHAVKV